MALPCGVDHKGMPFGIQVIGPKGADARVLEVAYALEQVLAERKETARAVPDVAPSPPASIAASPERGSG